MGLGEIRPTKVARYARAGPTSVVLLHEVGSWGKVAMWIDMICIWWISWIFHIIHMLVYRDQLGMFWTLLMLLVDAIWNLCQTYPQSLGLYDEDLRSDAGARICPDWSENPKFVFPF